MNRILAIILIISFNVFSLKAQDEYNAIQVDANYDFLIENFSYCSFYEYYIDANTTLENDVLINLKDSLSDQAYFSEDNESIQVYSIVSLNWSNTNYNFVYYSKNIDDKKEFLFSGFTKLNDSKLNELKNVLRLRNDVFWYFYNNELDEDYQGLNQIRLTVNDDNGVLNFFRLADAIAENQSIFNQFIID